MRVGIGKRFRWAGRSKRNPTALTLLAALGLVFLAARLNRRINLLQGAAQLLERRSLRRETLQFNRPN